MSAMTPAEIVKELDKHIIGQQEAKRAVAIALRNRWRRMPLDEELRQEVTPKNILMIGPTGVGKTEIARRLAKIAKAPFIKVEATKFTEIGYVGREVDSIIKDLVSIALKMLHEQKREELLELAEQAAEQRLLETLLPTIDNEEHSNVKELMLKRLRNGDLDEKFIELDLNQQIGVEIMGPPGMEEMTSQLQNMIRSVQNDKKRKRKLKIKDALRNLTEEELDKLIDEQEMKTEAVELVEQNGIVFIDEIDKVAGNKDSRGADVSREGVQRDLLPLIEGCTVNTKYGMVKTDHVLFITSGAFHLSKPSDLVPELQGRLPIRVELKSLSPEEFMRILVEPDASLTEQYKALIDTEKLSLSFTKDAIKRLAHLAWEVNESVENIGARRLHTIMEKLLEDISFHAIEYAEAGRKRFKIDAKYVNKQLGDLVKNEDLSRYIL